MEEDKLMDLLTMIIQGLVSNKEDVAIDKKVDEMGVLYTVRVNKNDVGMVIGKKGVIANAIRTIIRSVGMLTDVKASMKIDVPDNEFNNKG